MKKIAILTSVLALAACGGGSGHHHNGTPVTPGANNPEPVRDDTVTDAVRASNKEITQMTSEILIGRDSNTPVISRAAHGQVNIDGQEYTSYRLNDVEFTQSDLDDDNENVHFKFHVKPNGQIDRIDYEDGWELERKDNTASFENDEATVDLKNYGTLKYADFGIMHVNSVEDGEHNEQYMAFAGGYDVMEIDKDKVQDALEFTGRAVGGVFAEYNGNGGNKDSGLSLDTNDAKLVFDKGAETLTMNFDNWYDVKITKNGNVANVEFTNGDTKDIADKYTFKQTKYTDFTKNDTKYWEDGIRGMYETDMYGANGNPSEATAVTFISESSHDANNVLRETNFNAAFGGKRK